MSEPSTISLVFIVLVTGAAALWDLRTGTIPNRLVLVGAAACAAATLYTSLGSGGVKPALIALLAMALGAVFVSIVPGLLYRAGGIGGGDLKLLAAVGVALGPYLGLEAEFYAFVVALLYAPARLIWEGKLGQTLRTTMQVFIRPLLPRARRPEPVAVEELTALRFGPAIFLGTLTVAVHHLGGIR